MLHLNKRVIAGVISGVALTEVLFALRVPNAVFYYGAVVLGACVAAWIGKRLYAGLVVPVYVIAWKAAGLYFMARQYGWLVVHENMLAFLVDYTLVLLAGCAGAWLGVFAGKFKLVRKEETGTV